MCSRHGPYCITSHAFGISELYLLEAPISFSCGLLRFATPNVFKIVYRCHLINVLFADLEAEATAPRESRMQLPEQQVRYCIYMMEKYGEDYKVWEDNLTSLFL